MASLLLQFDLNTLFTILCAIVVLIISYFSSRKWLVPKGKVTAPEAFGGWPIFGHLGLLKGPQPAHKTLGAMADRCGPVFAIRIGSHRGLVVSSSEMAKECFTTNDLALASRPDMLAAKYFGYGNAMFGLAPYGPFWREIRKIATLEFLSNRRLEMLKHVRVSEVAAFLKELHKHWATKRSSCSMNHDPNSGRVLVEMKQRISDMALNVILRMVAGKRYSCSDDDDDQDRDVKEARLIKRTIKEFFKLIGLFVPGDAVPWLGWLDLGGYEKAMKKAANELDGILGQWLEEHKRKRDDLAVNSTEGKKELDFMDVMLSALHGSDYAGHDADTINKATVSVPILHSLFSLLN